MPQDYKPKLRARKYTRTLNDILEKAKNEHQGGALQKTVCAKYRIVWSVFQRYLKEDPESCHPPGGQTGLTSEMERSITHHLLFVSEWGFSFDTMDLRMTVKRILGKQGITIPRLKDNVPGEDWCYSFLKQHKSHLKNCVSKHLKKNMHSLVMTLLRLISITQAGAKWFIQAVFPVSWKDRQWY